MSHKYLEKTMEPIDFKPAHEALHRFCDGRQKLCIPVEKDDDDNKISDTLECAQYQINKLKSLLNNSLITIKED